MSEGLPFAREPEPESFTPDSDRDTKKKKRKALRGGFMKIAAEQTSEQRPPMPDKAFRMPKTFLEINNPDIEEPETKKKRKRKKKNRDRNSQSSNEKSDSEQEQSADSSQSSTIEESSVDGTEAQDDSEQSEKVPQEYSELEWRDLKPSELSGGEVVVDLKAVSPDAEYVVLQRRSSDANAESELSSDSETPAETEHIPESEPVADESTAEFDISDSPEEDIDASTHKRPSRPVILGVGGTAAAVSGAGGASARRTTSGFMPSSSGSRQSTSQTKPPISAGGAGMPPQPPGGWNAYSTPSNPNNIGSGGYNVAPVAAASSAAPNLLRRMLDSNAEYASGRRRGRFEGVFAGLLLGGGIEHFRHKRRERKMEKSFANERRQHEQSLEDKRWDSIREQQAEKARTDWNNRLEARQNEREQGSPTEQLLQGQSVPERASEDTLRTQPEGNSKRSEKGPTWIGPVPVASNETVRSARSETVAETERLAKEADRLLIEQAQKEAEAMQERLAEKEHHLERSAWHTVEVDKQGHAVDRPEQFEYGHEYYRERAKERAPFDDDNTKSAAGGVALTAAALKNLAGDSSEEAQISRDNQSVLSGSQASNSQDTSSKSSSSTDLQQSADLSQIVPLIVILVVIIVAIFILM